MLCSICKAQEKIILLNEGNWQSDNAKISYFEEDHIVSNQWFRDVNGTKIGDTPNDIIQINDDLIAIAVNASNIIQFIRPNGKAVAATEDIPNNRRLATDGSYLYVTSYAHECETTSGTRQFERGFVAKIDTRTFRVVDAVEVGYEPEGIALYRGHLFVANTGGYAFQENHDYESNVSIIDVSTMKVVGNVDTGCPNLYGQMSQSGKYLLINSAGDYYEHPGCSIILDCEKALNGESSFRVIEAVATYSTRMMNGSFIAIGSDYSYLDGGYELTYSIIDPEEAFHSGQVTNSLPETVASVIQDMAMPYGIYVNPYTGYIYATDAASNASQGKLYQWNPDGKLLGSHKVYINPGHILALPPDGHFNGIEELSVPEETDSTYDLYGRTLHAPASLQFFLQRHRISIIINNR